MNPLGALMAVAMAAQPVPGATSTTDLDLWREIEVYSGWVSCCGAFPVNLPVEIQRRIDVARAALERTHGAELVAVTTAAARLEFYEEFGVYDPVPMRLTARQRDAQLRSAQAWYDEHLDRLESRLGISRP